MTLEKARILEKFELTEANLLGVGSESLVYALGQDQILRLPKSRPFDPGSRARLRSFLDEIAGHLPFGTPRIDDIGPNEDYTIEARVPGRSMADFLKTAADDARDHAFRSYVAAIDAFRGVEFPDHPYGHLLATAPVWSGDWRTFAHDSLAEFRSNHRVAIARDVGDPYRLFDKAADMIEHLPAYPPKALVHGDYFPGNVLLGADLQVSGVIDFGPFTLAGDPVLDFAVSYLTLELIDECTADDARFVRELIVERHGEAIVPALRFYRAYLAFSMADPSNTAPPYPRLYGWSVAMLKLLSDDRLPV
jgi:aminoglycoside phosphotransferase (APT) family kinase protein